MIVDSIRLYGAVNRSHSSPHLDDRVSLSSGEVPVGLGATTVATGPDHSPVLWVTMNLSWLEMGKGGFLWADDFSFQVLTKPSQAALTFLAESMGFPWCFPSACQ